MASVTLLFRTLIREIAVPFFFSLAALSAVLLLGRLLPLLGTLLRSGITFGELGLLLLLLLPTFLLIVLPMATLLGVLLAFLRLSRDSEILALFACGIGPRSLLVPVTAVAMVAWLATLATSTVVLPQANAAARAFLHQMTERHLARGLPEKVFLTPVEGLAIYVHKTRSDGRRLRGIYIRDARNPTTTSQILARRGEVFTKPDGGEIVLRLFDGSLHRTSPDYQQADTMDFGSYTVRLTLPGGSMKPRRGNMTLSMLRHLARDPDTEPNERRLVLVEFHKRLALPAAAFILGILGFPLGILFGRTGLSGGVALGLSAFLAYYLCLAMGANLAETGVLSPGLGLWLPNVLFAAATGGLILLLERKGPLRG